MAQQFADRLHDHTHPALGPLSSVFRSVVRSGALDVRDSAGKIHHFGDGAGESVALRFLDSKIQRRFLFDPQLAIGEGYMQGRIVLESGTIYDLLALFARNLQQQRLPVWMRFADKFRMLRRWSRQRNRAGRAKRNVAHHYDLPSALYGLFLDPDRQYSCAYFARGDETLEEAQLAKKRHIAAKLRLAPGLSVLDIGSGWGGLSLYLAQAAGVKVTGITLSEEQLAYAQARAAREGNGAVEFRLADYRSLRERFDRIVSVGMFEHVGLPNYRTFFNKVYDCLKEDGVALLHTIGRLSGPGTTNPFIEKYIFPGGYVPALSEIAPHIEAAGLFITDIEVLRLHYAKTLEAWRLNFKRAWGQAASMLSEEFCRMWEFYLAGCEVGFRYHDLAVFQIQLAKRLDAAPLTRDYLRDS